MKIKEVIGREIFDSRGFPTIECEIRLDNDHAVRASVPSGASKGSHEALELRDEDRLLGKGVSRIIYTIEHIIAPLILGRQPDIFAIDSLLIDLDGTRQKEKLGANAILAVSIAVLRAQAHMEGMELYELIAGLLEAETVSLPFPMFNVINGGAHANNNLRIQEFMIMPIAGQQFRESMEVSTMIYHALGDLLKKRGYSIAVGDEGGYAPNLKDEREAFDLIVEAIQKVSSLDYFRIGLDVAATEFYNVENGIYYWHDQELSADGMINMYDLLTKEYPIFSIEDGLAENDWDGWHAMLERLGSHIQVIGDDLFATRVERIAFGLDQQAANGVIIKPNQIGTVSETLEAIRFAQQSGMATIISHRSGETEDTFIADLAVGSSAGQIKAGGCSRSERMAKYNRLLRIEDALIFSVFPS